MMRVCNLVVIDCGTIMVAHKMMPLSGCIRRLASLMLAAPGAHPDRHGHQGIRSDREQQQCRQGEPGETLLMFADLLEHGAI